MALNESAKKVRDIPNTKVTRYNRNYCYRDFVLEF